MYRIAWQIVLIMLMAASLSAADMNEDLLTAARKGDLDGVRQSVEMGAEIEAKTAYGQTPLYLAAMNGHENIVRYLLEKGASTDITDTFYKMPMMSFILSREHYDIVKLLLQKGTKTPDLLLPQLAQTGRADLVQALLEHSRPSQSTVDSAYENALLGKQKELAEVLKNAGARDPAPPLKLDVKVIEAYAGTYKSSSLPLDISVFVKDGTLFMQATGQGEFPLKPRSETLFEFTAGQIVVEFNSASSFTLKQRGASYEFKKAVTE